MAKVASVETPGLREDDRQDTLTEDGQDGRYITCTDPFPKEDTHAQTHRHPYGLYSIRIYPYITCTEGLYSIQFAGKTLSPRTQWTVLASPSLRWWTVNQMRFEVIEK